MIRVTKHTSDICGCITWFEWDDQTPEGSRVHTDIAVSPCQIHDPVNFGNTVIHDSSSNSSKQLVIGSTEKSVIFILDVRPAKIKDIIPLSMTLIPREEMYLREGARAVLLNVDEISEDALDEEGKPAGRQFKEDFDVSLEYNEDRKLVVRLEGVSSSEKQIAETAITDSSLDKDKIIVS